MLERFDNMGGRSWLQGRKLLPLLHTFGAKSKGTVLDLGCGQSPFREFFPGAKFYLRIDRYPADADVVIAEADRLPLKTATVNTVLLFRMMGDLPDTPALMREVARVLEPGGRALIYESISYPQHDLPHDYWRVMPAGLRWAANKAGLEVSAIEYLGGYFTQLSTHWNTFVLGHFERYRILRPFVFIARLSGNAIFLVLDWLVHRPELASDYFACLTKPHQVATSEFHSRGIE